MTDRAADHNAAKAPDLALAVLNAIQNPVILVDAEGFVAFANWEAESFFGASANHLAKYRVSSLIPFGSPLLTLIEQVRERKAPVSEYRVDLSSPRLGADKLADIYVAPVTTEPAGSVVVVTDHTHTERGFLPILGDRLAAALPGVAIVRSGADVDPLVPR